MFEPNFLVIGAQKCGTSWISSIVRQHPEVFAPTTKELHFFNKEENYRKGIDWYQEQFAGAAKKKAIGEFTPNYFWTSNDSKEIEESGRTRDIPNLIKKHYPDIKIILALRNPVDRAISAFYHHIKARRISPKSCIFDVKENYGILSMGYYDEHLKNFLKYFSEEQFLILIYEDEININKMRTIKKIFKFLGISEFFEPKNYKVKYNARKSHFYMHMNYYSPKLARILIRGLPSVLLTRKFWDIPIRNTEIDYLKKIYKPHNKNLSVILRRNLPW